MKRLKFLKITAAVTLLAFTLPVMAGFSSGRSGGYSGGFRSSSSFSSSRSYSAPRYVAPSRVYVPQRTIINNTTVVHHDSHSGGGGGSGLLHGVVGGVAGGVIGGMIANSGNHNTVVAQPPMVVQQPVMASPEQVAPLSQPEVGQGTTYIQNAPQAPSTHFLLYLGFFGFLVFIMLPLAIHFLRHRD